MKEVFCFFRGRVIYRSFYDTEISMGNTSTGRLTVDYLGKCEGILKSLVNAGYKVYPVVLLGSDLLGRICREYLKNIGCMTDYICREKEKTDFLFVLETGESQRTVYRYITETPETECPEYMRCCRELCKNRKCIELLSGTDKITAAADEEEFGRLEELLRKE